MRSRYNKSLCEESKGLKWGLSSLLLRRFVFRMAEASAQRVTGDEPQGTMGRVQTAVSPVVSFPPSFARTFSSKERRLGTRQGSERSDFFRPEISIGCSSILSEFVELSCSLENIQTNKQIGNILKTVHFV